MARSDDEDWLYRRGRYADDAASSVDAMPEPVGQASMSAARSRGRPAASDPYGETRPRTSAPASRSRTAADLLPAPTPVADYPRSAPSPRPAPPAARPTTAVLPTTAARPTTAALPTTAARPSPPVRPPSGPRWRPLTPRRIVGLVALALVAFVVYLVAVPVMAFGSLGRADATPTGARPAYQPGQLYVLVGSDSREGLSPAEQQKLGTGDDAGRRSDTLMLLYVPPSGKTALISIPRDSYVAIPGRGKDKINAAYSVGGAKLLVQTVEKTTGLRVDGYAEIGFGGFVSIVDAVGGVTMCPPQNYDDPLSNLHVKAGCQTFNGPTALAYARMRHEDPLGDLGRIQRQRELVGAVAKQIANPATVLLPWRYWAVTTASAKALTIGRNDSVTDVAGLGQGLASVASGDGIALTVPIDNPNLDTPSGSAVSWDDKLSKEMFAAIAKGDTAALAKFQK